MREYDRREERTGVQEHYDFHPVYDVQSDFVMVYGLHNLKARIKQWKKHGYVIHLMTGVSWGHYMDYLYGKYDGRDHHDEAQLGKTREYNHGVDVPYMVPSNSYAHYLCEKLKEAVDLGVEAIHLEEPEFFVGAGYSEAFKREWQIFYKEPWQDPQSSCDAQYRASKLKQYLYTRTLDRLCAELKEYAMVKYGRLLRFYVPTHSLINYAQWKLISPESALIDLPTIDGYIAQIWTGTARVENCYRGITRERTFETAYLEYGIMQELVRGTGRRMWYLADPIEDDPSHTWTDYRENYYRTVVASLFHPAVTDYEVAPWPGRVMCERHEPTEETYQICLKEVEAWKASGKPLTEFRREVDTSVLIPPEYKANLLTVMHTLRDMADQKENLWMTKSAEIGVMMADSAMFQRICPEPGGDDSKTFSSFFGLALPLVKAGISARPLQLDNIRRFAGYLDAYETCVLSYEYMKPSAPDIHQALGNWVRKGGVLIYVGDGSDPFHKVREWWNSGACDYANPAEHLMEALGLDRAPADGVYQVGNGRVLVINEAPRKFSEEADASDRYLEKVIDLLRSAGKEIEVSGKFIMRRGCYYVTSVLDECGQTDHELKGTFIDLFDHRLPVIEDPILTEGSVNLWYDLSRIDKSQNSDILALSGRASKIQRNQRSLTFTFSGPSAMMAVGRIWTKRPPKSIKITVGKETTDLPFEYEPDSETTFFTFPSNGEKVKVSVAF